MDLNSTVLLVELSVNDQNTIGPQRAHSLNVCKYIFPVALGCANNAVARVFFTHVFFCPDRAALPRLVAAAWKPNYLDDACILEWLLHT